MIIQTTSAVAMSRQKTPLLPTALRSYSSYSGTHPGRLPFRGSVVAVFFIVVILVAMFVVRLRQELDTHIYDMVSATYRLVHKIMSSIGAFLGI